MRLDLSNLPYVKPDHYIERNGIAIKILNALLIVTVYLSLSFLFGLKR